MKDFSSILRFWFEEIKPAQWWTKDPLFDAEIRKRFFETYEQAIKGELNAWRDHAEGALAEIILLDQFSRNMFRGTAESFTADPLALCLAQYAIRLGLDQKLSTSQKSFMYMPFMHSESPEIHKSAVRLFEQAKLEQNLAYELQHKNIIDRFGRYPHRNAILNRPSTPEELEFLKEEGSHF